MNTQTTTLICSFDLTSQVERDLSEARLKRTEREAYGPCPRCGGTDRFRIHRYGDREWAACRQCHNKPMDAITYLQWLHGTDYRSALQMLQSLTNAAPLPSSPVAKSLNIDIPTSKPITNFCKAASDCAIKLQGMQGPMRYLTEQRGLLQGTILAAGLGWHADNPTGLTIPWRHAGSIVGIKVRLARQMRSKLRYMWLAGSKQGRTLYSLADIGQAHTAIIVEGELDCLLLQQFVPDGIAVVTTGSAAPDAKLYANQLAHIKRIFVTTDNDNAGHFQANRWHQARPDSIRILPPVGKDIGESFSAGIDFVTWLSNSIAE